MPPQMAPPRKPASRESVITSQPGKPREGETHPGSQDRPDDHLAFSPDVDDITPKRDADSDRHQEQWRGLYERFRESVATPERAVPKRGVGIDRIDLQEQEHHGRQRQRRQRRQDGQKPVNQSRRPLASEKFRYQRPGQLRVSASIRELA